MKHSKDNVLKGDRFKVCRPFEVLLILSWKAPMTSGVRALLEPGLILTALHDVMPNAEGFYCTPENKEDFENKYIPKDSRLSESYGGFGVLINYSDIGTNIEREPVNNSV